MEKLRELHSHALSRAKKARELGSEKGAAQFESAALKLEYAMKFHEKATGRKPTTRE